MTTGKRSLRQLTGKAKSRYLRDVLANAGAGLHHRLVHLRPNALAQHGFAAFFDELTDVRAQLARLGVDDLKLFFDAQRELSGEHVLRRLHDLLSAPLLDFLVARLVSAADSGDGTDVRAIGGDSEPGVVARAPGGR